MPRTGGPGLLVRSLRVSHGIDLQAIMSADMKANFSKYPQIWGLGRPDRNIDHRRVPNLRRLFERMGAELPLGTDPKAFRPGDIVTSVLPGNRAHTMIVTDHQMADGVLMVVHNIGLGARLENALFDCQCSGSNLRLSDEKAALQRESYDSILFSFWKNEPCTAFAGAHFSRRRRE